MNLIARYIGNSKECGQAQEIFICLGGCTNFIEAPSYAHSILHTNYFIACVWCTVCNTCMELSYGGDWH